MPESFYGGKSGAPFNIAAIFSNKVELDADQEKRFNSEVPMNSFVAISYGRKNTSDYATNKKIDQDKYGQQYNATLWYKVYSETTITETFAGEDRYGVKYVLIYDFAGQTPTIDFTNTELLDPASDPFIDVFNIDDPNYPVLQAHLPRSVNWYTGLKLTAREGNILLSDNDITYYVGDLYLNKYNGNLYKCTIRTDANRVSSWNYEGNLLGPTLEVNSVVTNTISPLDNAMVTISQERDTNDVLIPLVDFVFSIPRGTRFFSGQGTYNGNTLTSIPDPNNEVRKGDYFLESSVNGKIGAIYILGENNTWQFVTSIIGSTPIFTAQGIPVNPDKILNIEIVYQPNDTAHNNPLLKFEVPRGNKIFVQAAFPTVGTASINNAARGDIFFNTSDGCIYEYIDSTTQWVKVGNFVIDLSTIESQGIDPYVVVGESSDSATPAKPEFSLIIDEDNPATKPKAIAKLPNAPLVTVDRIVDVLSYEERGQVSLKYNTKGYELKFKLPRGPQGEIGKSLNIRRSYNTIAERDANADGVLWKDADACAVRHETGSNYYDIYTYQTDYPGGWVYVGTMEASIVDDSKVSTENTWSSQKINTKIDALEDTLTESINSVRTDLEGVINQNIQDQLAEIQTKVTTLETNSATKAELATVQRALTLNIVNIVEKHIPAIINALNQPFTWKKLKNGMGMKNPNE